MAPPDSGSPGHSSLPGNLLLIDDLHLGRRHIIGTYVLTGDEPALVDPGPASTLPALEAGLAQQGLAFGDVHAILLTHIHLDHAGATGTLVHRYPHLRVYVHERGAPHMVNPERLISSATRLYGDEMDRLWGEFRPVPEERITALRGGETVRLGGRALRVAYAPGHASHHVVYYDEESGGVFTGDVAGIQMPGSGYTRPATPPPDIDLEAWETSFRIVLEFRPRLLLLSHFGPIFEPAAHVEDFRARLLRWAGVVRAGLQSGESEAAQIERLRALADEELHALGAGDRIEEYRQAGAVSQSWQGLARYWRKRGIGQA